MGDPRFKNIEFKVGLFILMSLILFFVFIIGFLVQQDFFAAKVKVVFISQSGEGLSKSMPVMYSGFQIAKIYSIELRDDGLVELRAMVPVRYKKWIKPQSSARIQAQGVIGANAIVLSGGIESKDSISDGQTYKLTRDQQIADLIKKFEPMLDNIKHIVSNVDDVTTSVADKRKSIEDLLGGMGSLGNDVENKKGSIGFLTRSDYIKVQVMEIMGKIQQAQDNLIEITNKVDTAAAGVNDRIDESKPVVADLDKGILSIKQGADDIGALAKNLNQTVTKLQKTVENTNKITTDVSDTTTNLKDLRKQTDEILNTSNRILLNLENKWPFSNQNIQKTNEKVKLP